MRFHILYNRQVSGTVEIEADNEEHATMLFNDGKWQLDPDEREDDHPMIVEITADGDQR